MGNDALFGLGSQPPKSTGGGGGGGGSVNSVTGTSGVIVNNTDPANPVVSGANLLGKTLASGKVFVGNGSNVATGVNITGDITIDDTGAATLKSSVALAGNPTTTTQTSGDNSTKIATTAFVTTAISNATIGGGGSTVNVDYSLRNAGSTTAAQLSTRNVSSGYYNPTQYQKWEVKLQDVVMSVANARIATPGDSITAGSNRYNDSYPARLRDYFNAAGIRCAEGFVAATSIADSRWTAGSDWAPVGSGLGPGIAGQHDFTATSGSSNLTFAPGYAFDRLDVYYVKHAGHGTFDVKIDGSSIGSIDTTLGTGVGTIAKHSYTSGISLGTHTITFVAPGGTGTVSIVGLEAWDSSKKQVLIGNWGAGGATSGSWATAGTLDLLKTYAPDLSYILLGTNDAANTFNLTNYETYVTSISDAGVLSGSVCLCSTVPTDPLYATNVFVNEQAEQAWLISKATTDNLGYSEVLGSFGSYSAASGLYADQLHPTSGIGWSFLALIQYLAIGAPRGFNVTNPDAVQAKNSNLDLLAGGSVPSFIQSAIDAGDTGGGGTADGIGIVPTATSLRVAFGSKLNNGGGTLLGYFGTTSPPTLTGTATNDDDSDGMWVKLTSGSTSGNDASIVVPNALCHRAQKPRAQARLKIVDTTSLRFFFGFSAYAGSDPLGNDTAANAFGFRFNPATDTNGNIRFYTANSSGTATEIDTGVAYSAGPMVMMVDGSNPASIKGYINGTLVATSTTNIHDASTSGYFGGPTIGVRTLTNAAKAIKYAALLGDLVM